jgi:hypothetical protein
MERRYAVLEQASMRRSSGLELYCSLPEKAKVWRQPVSRGAPPLDNSVSTRSLVTAAGPLSYGKILIWTENREHSGLWPKQVWLFAR